MTADDLRVVEVDLDPTVPAVGADGIGLVVNQYARVYITSGSLMVHTAIAMLFGSAALFLILLGFVATLIHRRVGDSELDWLRTG